MTHRIVLSPYISQGKKGNLYKVGNIPAKLSIKKAMIQVVLLVLILQKMMTEVLLLALILLYMSCFLLYSGNFDM